MTDDRTSLHGRTLSGLGLLLVEFALVAGLFVADVYHHIFFSKTPYLFVLGWASLRLRGMRWKDVGFARPKSWGKAIGVGIAVGVAMELFELFIITAPAHSEKPPRSRARRPGADHCRPRLVKSVRDWRWLESVS